MANHSALFFSLHQSGQVFYLLATSLLLPLTDHPQMLTLADNVLYQGTWLRDSIRLMDNVKQLMDHVKQSIKHPVINDPF